ncbi:Heat-inducible transcription repressor HrcA [hydrothermal vent metagenome]|uniref:Heat-inducible transcription repressor HrcA n=1 Tax=hydrothermal vent metagenome TaxID=652676 RepID=A0A3B1BYE4_9ZZZZ
MRQTFNMDQRTAKVLKAAIESYIEKAEPVAARSISRNYNFNLSPASIRSVMADLEDAGFLSKPHTSAGRVPSDKGYRCYAEDLATHVGLNVAETERIRKVTFCSEAGELKEMLSAVSHALSEFTSQAGLVGLSSFASAPVKKVKFVSMEDNLVLAVIISTGGEMRNQLVRTDENFKQDDLDKLSNYFNDRFSGLALELIRKKLLAEIKKDRVRMDDLVAMALAMATELAEKTDNNEDGSIFMDGASNLIDQHSAKLSMAEIKALLKTLDEKKRLALLLNECLISKNVNLIIGAESEIEELKDFSLITHSFSGTEGAIGAVGVIGPRPMDYGRIMALVAYAAEQISITLTGCNEEITR